MNVFFSWDIAIAGALKDWKDLRSFILFSINQINSIVILFGAIPDIPDVTLEW